MKPVTAKDLEKRVVALCNRCPWVAQLILHCLKTRNPKSIAALRLMLTRLRLTYNV